MMHLTFVGTGAAGGTPGRGRSRRQESSLLISDGAELLIDAPRHLDNSLKHPDKLDAILLTHAHHDAAGGLAALGRQRIQTGLRPLPLYSSPQALDFLGRRGNLKGFRPRPVEPGRGRRLSDELRIRAVEVPHARQDCYRTYAWRIDGGTHAFVYASDVGRLEPGLERLCQDAELLILDGAMWRRSLFSHLRIDRDLPVACGWAVKRILLTQIGRTAPPDQQLKRELRSICPKAAAAWDGLKLAVDSGAASTGTGIVLIGVAALVFLVNVLARLAMSSQNDRDREQRARDPPAKPADPGRLAWSRRALIRATSPASARLRFRPGQVAHDDLPISRDRRSVQGRQLEARVRETGLLRGYQGHTGQGE